MSEIKFKVWDSWHECMFDVEWIGFNPLWVGVIDVDTDPNGNPIQVQRKLEYHFELLRFTGLYDKKRTEKYPYGQPIYEGDIISLEDRLCVVEWNEFNGCWDLNFVKYRPAPVGFGFERCTPDLYSKRANVIGNIYENGDLVK